MSTTLKNTDLLNLMGIDEASLAKGRKPIDIVDPAQRKTSGTAVEDSQITFDDMTRTQGLAGTVPTTLTENYRNCFLRGMTPENCWNNAVAGQHIPEDKVEQYKMGCGRFVTDSDKTNLKHKVIEAAAELVRAEDIIALETTPADSNVDWVSARREACYHMEKQGIPPGIVTKAAELADSANQSTPAKLRKLEAQKLHIAEKIYPDALKYTDHAGAVSQIRKACEEIHIALPSATYLASLPHNKLTTGQKSAIAEMTKKRTEISRKHYEVARESMQPSRAGEAAQRDLRKELGVDYAIIPDGYKTLEANYTSPVQQKQIEEPAREVVLNVQKLGTSDQMGLTPVHFAAAAGKLTDIAEFLKANQALLSIPATAMDDKTVGLAASFILDRKVNSGRPNPLRHDQTGITPAQMAVRFGHGEQLRTCGIDPATVPPLDPDPKKAAMLGARLGKDGQEMLAEQYYPLSILAARKSATNLGLDFNEALSTVAVKFNKTLDKYSPAHGTTFPEYCYPLMQMSVIDAKQAQDPRTDAERAQADALAEIKDRLAQELGRTADSADVAEELGITEAQLAKLEESVAKPEYTSLDAGSENDEGQERNKHELIADEQTEKTQESSESDLDPEERQAIRKGIAQVADQLNDEYRQTMLLRFACGCPNQDVAWMLGCSASQVNAIETAVKHRLHAALESTVKSIQARRTAPAVAPKQQQDKINSNDFGRDD